MSIVRISGETILSFIIYKNGEKDQAKVRLYRNTFKDPYLYKEIDIPCIQHTSLTRSSQLRLVIVSECPGKEAELSTFLVTPKELLPSVKIPRAIANQG